MARKASNFGILLIFESSDAAKNMTHQSIIQAIDNLHRAEVKLEDQLLQFNQLID